MEEEDGHLSLGCEVQCGGCKGVSLPTAVEFCSGVQAQSVLLHKEEGDCGSIFQS